MEQDLTDERKYGPNDLVKAGCHDCDGCSLCCQGMGDSIILDPYDIYRLTVDLQTSFEQLMAGHLELHMQQGCILPNLRMVMTAETEANKNRLNDKKMNQNNKKINDEINYESGQQQAICIYLNDEGRCSIHNSRPGLCRLFPLGRDYSEGKLSYILLQQECPKENKTKVKVSKWIDTPELKKNQKFLIQWHDFLKKVRESLAGSEDESFVKNSNLFILNKFYVQAYDETKDFFEQFDMRMQEAEEALGL